MSAHKLRKEKNCLNCNAEIVGRFCQVCGQENIEPDESFWQLCVHFIADIFHYDGKFFRTIRFLLFKPAYVTKEYIRGRRASYLHPIRLYIFTSAVFFIFFFTFIVSEEDTEAFAETTTEKQQLSEKIDSIQTVLSDRRESIKDSSKRKVLEQTIVQFAAASELLSKDSTTDLATIDSLIDGINWADWNTDSTDISDKAQKTNRPDSSNDLHFNFMGDADLPQTVEAYTSVQAALPKDKRDGIFRTWFNEKQIELNGAYRKDPKAFSKNIIEGFLHALPKMLFISLPIVAFIFQLMYLRKKHKHHQYVYHGVFTIHLYVMIFLMLLLIYGFSKLADVTDWSLFSMISKLLSVCILYHIYKSMRNFYEQSRKKTILKFSIVLMLTTVLLSMLTLLFFINSAFTLHA